MKNVNQKNTQNTNSFCNFKVFRHILDSEGLRRFLGKPQEGGVRAWPPRKKDFFEAREKKSTNLKGEG